MSQKTSDEIAQLYSNTGIDFKEIIRSNVPHLEVNENHILGMQAVAGLNIDVEELADGIRAVVKVDEGTTLDKPVHLCFGMLPTTGIQRIIMDVTVGDDARIGFLAHCVFPFAVDVQHLMEGIIRVGNNAEYSYFERHVHSKEGGIRVVPKTKVEVGEHSVFRTEFELIKGRVGVMDIDYETTCGPRSIVEMMARVSGSADDRITIRETAHLNGEFARGALTSKIAVRDRAQAIVYNTMTASAAHARGHVDCKEIIQDQGSAKAIPVVEVLHPKAHVTHEAAIGSVDSKQLETLMSRGLSEDDAVDVIINGLLSR